LILLDCSHANPTSAPAGVLVVGQMAADGFLLLGCQNAQALPILKSDFNHAWLKVGVFGPRNYVDNSYNADIGSYGPSAGTVSILSGLQTTLGAGAVKFTEGCSSAACPEYDFSAAEAAVADKQIRSVVVVIGLEDTKDFNCTRSDQSIMDDY
jgi:hypothetical protein